MDQSSPHRHVKDMDQSDMYLNSHRSTDRLIKVMDPSDQSDPYHLSRIMTMPDANRNAGNVRDVNRHDGKPNAVKENAGIMRDAKLNAVKEKDVIGNESRHIAENVNAGTGKSMNVNAEIMRDVRENA